ncbi:MAG: vWA domain-containing protein [Actinomycetota bacterium]
MSATRTHPRRRRLAVLGAVALAIAACGSDATETAGGQPTDEVTTTVDGSVTDPPATPTTTTPANGGWLGGEPDWSGSTGDADAAEASASAADGDLATVEEDVAAGGDSSLESETIEPRTPGDDSIGPVPDEPLRAGSVDDGADFGGFLEYVDRVTENGFTARDLDVSGRIVVRVLDDTERPVPGIELVASQGESELVRVRTTADGTARFFPAMHGFDATAPVEFGVAVADTEPMAADPGTEITMVAPAAELASPVPLDVLFLLDATGSMGDEIDRLKRTIDTVADRVNQLDPRPDVRFAMTLYRDEGDAFVTSTFDFTSDIAVFRDALSDVVADGGGDYPEALDEGLADALTAPAWRDPSTAVQLVFLVADAPPQIARQVEMPYTDSIRTAAERGIKIFPIASSESDDVAELVFRQLAVTTGAPFVFLSYGAGGAATGGSTDIERTDYEELALDELVVRLIAEELAGLTGGDGEVPTPPTTVAPPTTNPDGQ